MSSILKALKRLEQSKTLRRECDHDMTWFIRGDLNEPVPRRRWPLILALVSVAAIAVVATYSVMTKFAGSTRPLPTGQAESDNKIQSGFRQSAPNQAATVPLPASQPVPVSVKPSVSEGNHQAKGTKNGHGIALPDGTVKTKPLSVVSANKGNVQRTSSARPNQRKPDAGSKTSSPSPEPAAIKPAPSREHPALHVGGIAWQKDSSSPMAIVNGTPVAEGSTVGGARVEKIYQERVRFSCQGRSFEVGLGASSNGR